MADQKKRPKREIQKICHRLQSNKIDKLSIVYIKGRNNS